MKKLFRYTVILIVTGISFSACQQVLTDARSAEIEKELRDMTDEILASLNEGDTATFFNYYSDHFTLLSMGEKKVADPETRSAWETAAWQDMAEGEGTVYTIEDIWFEVYAHNSANVCYTWIKTTTFENDSSDRSRGATTWTMLWEEGDWKIKHAHISGSKD